MGPESGAVVGNRSLAEKANIAGGYEENSATGAKP